MGTIEEIIFANYKKAMESGDFDQARKALELASVLKTKVEIEGFVDYQSLKAPASLMLGQFFNPFPYKYNYKDRIVELESTVIKLTNNENKLFALFSQNETSGTSIKVIYKKDIKNFLWRNKEVAPSAVRIAILRLRQKIEMNPKSPQIIISYQNSGYLFLGKKVDKF
jgi:DNA-binding winged helix-turn-helix (wHTH) protein